MHKEAEKIITRVVLKLRISFGNRFFPKVRLTLLPNARAPNTTKTLKYIIVALLFSSRAPKTPANEGAMPLAPIFIAKKITALISKTNLIKFMNLS